MYQCKYCGIKVIKQSEILEHYRLKHGNFGLVHRLKCIHLGCPCVFKTWSSLYSHLSRNHSKNSHKPETLVSFSSELCSFCELGTEHENFLYIGNHLKNNETVTCMFTGCDFKTNVHSTFRSHKSRKHKINNLDDFKDGVIKKTVTDSTEHGSENESDPGNAVDSEPTCSADRCIPDDQEHDVEHKLATVLLKLKNVYHVQSAALS